MFLVLQIPAFHVVLQIPAFHVPVFLVPRSLPRSVPRFPVPCFTDSLKRGMQNILILFLLISSYIILRRF